MLELSEALFAIRQEDVEKLRQVEADISITNYRRLEARRTLEYKYLRNSRLVAKVLRPTAYMIKNVRKLESRYADTKVYKQGFGAFLNNSVLDFVDGLLLNIHTLAKTPQVL